MHRADSVQNLDCSSFKTELEMAAMKTLKVVCILFLAAGCSKAPDSSGQLPDDLRPSWEHLSAQRVEGVLPSDDPETGIRWSSDFADACLRAEKQNKPIFVTFSFLSEGTVGAPYF